MLLKLPDRHYRCLYLSGPIDARRYDERKCRVQTALSHSLKADALPQQHCYIILIVNDQHAIKENVSDSVAHKR